MKRLFIPLLLFIVVVCEGVALEVLPTSLVAGKLMIIPHWTLVFLIMIAIFYDKENTYFVVLYGIIFGMLIDIVYTDVLGVYMFTYTVVVYLVHGLKKLLHANFYVTVLLGVIGIVIADFIIYIIFSVIRLTDFGFADYIGYRLLPTILANIILLIIIYPFMHKRLMRWSEEQLSNFK